MLDSPHEKVCKNSDGSLGVVLGNGKGTVNCQKVLLAMGRPPCTADLGLENTEVSLDREYVKVDELQNTS